MHKNYKLLLDNDCHMCKLYGHLFVKLKLIEPSALTSFQIESYNNNMIIDHKRAKSEIAFYNINTQETVYGVDAIIKIVSQNFNLLEKFLRLRFVNSILKFMYFFISYNRKQIIPVRETIECLDCTPEFKLGYRWSYILFSAATTAIILTTYFASIFTFFEIKTFFLNEYLVCFGQIVWQWTAINKLASSKWIDYLGNMSTVSLMGGILLVPLILLDCILQVTVVFKLIYFFCVVTVMVLEHLRRCNLLEISHLMTISWIAYRIFVLILMFVFFNIF